MISTAVSPGKLILSGEHAVVHGAPALAMAVDRFARVAAETADASSLTLRLAGRPPVSVSLDTLAGRLRETLDRQKACRAGALPIREVCPEPEDLLLAACAKTEPDDGLEIRVESDIPIGAGLGSSAACLLALLRALRPDWDRSTLFQKALDCEQFQHGASSGIDVAASLHGGVIWSEKGAHTPMENPRLPDFTVYDTGRPDSSTGECVARVGKAFPSDHAVWSEFATVTRRFREAIRESDIGAWRGALRDNHRLLCRIGVVPEPIRSVVHAIEAAGGAAKVCGAGGLGGDRAGMLLVSGPVPASLPRAWTRLDLAISPRGTHDKGG